MSFDTIPHLMDFPDEDHLIYLDTGPGGFFWTRETHLHRWVCTGILTHITAIAMYEPQKPIRGKFVPFIVNGRVVATEFVQTNDPRDPLFTMIPNHGPAPPSELGSDRNPTSVSPSEDKI